MGNTEAAVSTAPATSVEVSDAYLSGGGTVRSADQRFAWCKTDDHKVTKHVRFLEQPTWVSERLKMFWQPSSAEKTASTRIVDYYRVEWVSGRGNLMRDGGTCKSTMGDPDKRAPNCVAYRPMMGDIPHRTYTIRVAAVFNNSGTTIGSQCTGPAVEMSYTITAAD